MKTHKSCNYISGYLLTQKTHHALEAYTVTKNYQIEIIVVNITGILYMFKIFPMFHKG